MISPLSLDAIVSSLEAQIAFHQEREAFHAEREKAHQERRAVHAAELETLTRNLATFKAAASQVVDLASRTLPVAPSSPSPDPDAGRKLSLIRMVARVVESQEPGEAFGTAAVTAELNRRYQDRLRKPVKARLVSVNLRRLLAAGQLRSVREGRPHYEALYTRP